MGQPHKHRDLIRAWADGAEIEYLNVDGEWQDAGSGVLFSPAWKPSTEYRIKPEPKPDVVAYLILSLDFEDWTEYEGDWSYLKDKTKEKIKLIRDGEYPHKIKSAEVLK